MRSKPLLIAAITAGVVLIPVSALAATVAVPAEASYLVLLAAGWFFLDKLIEFTPLKDDSTVAAIRTFLNNFFAKKPQ